MKGDREHRVPLSDAALDVLRRTKADRKGDVLFPSLPHDRPLSNMALLTVLKRMARTDITVHGFRSTFKDWAREQTNFPNEVSEAALAHLTGDETERAYARGDLFEKRRSLMAAWEATCGGQQSTNVLPFPAAEARVERGPIPLDRRPA
jgi:integrase